MNYFAHGIRYLSQPWVLAGTATPDWLSVADRKVRMRDRQVRPFLNHEDPRLKMFAQGVLQHLHDDQWFHESVPFYEITSEVAACFRSLPDQDDGFLPGFLGHISTELLLDRLLMEEYPGAIDCYYETTSTLDSAQIERFVNLLAKRKTNQLKKFIDIFNQIEFLKDYLETRQLLRRLNQVLHRVKLQPLPDRAEAVLDSAWEIVRQRGWELLPKDKFSIDQPDLSFTHRRTPK